MLYTKKLLTAVATILIISACAEQGGPLTKQSAGTILGAVGGAVVGSQVGKGTGNVAAIALGTLGGAALGNSIGASLDNVDRMHMARTQQSTLETARSGQTTQWSNPDSGHSGTFTPIRTYQVSSGQYCREFTETVNIGGQASKAYGKACRQPDGNWRIVEN